MKIHQAETELLHEDRQAYRLTCDEANSRFSQFAKASTQNELQVLSLVLVLPNYDAIYGFDPGFPLTLSIVAIILSGGVSIRRKPPAFTGPDSQIMSKYLY
jgi:hypothetical protein